MIRDSTSYKQGHLAVISAYGLGILSAVTLVVGLLDVVAFGAALISCLLLVGGWAIAVVLSFRARLGLLAVAAIIPFLIPLSLGALFAYKCGFLGSCL